MKTPERKLCRQGAVGKWSSFTPETGLPTSARATVPDVIWISNDLASRNGAVSPSVRPAVSMLCRALFLSFYFTFLFDVVCSEDCFAEVNTLLSFRMMIKLRGSIGDVDAEVEHVNELNMDILPRLTSILNMEYFHYIQASLPLVTSILSDCFGPIEILLLGLLFLCGLWHYDFTDRFFTLDWVPHRCVSKTMWAHFETHQTKA